MKNLRIRRLCGCNWSSRESQGRASGKRLGFALLLISLCMQSPRLGSAQISATQGVEDPNLVKSFHSPMVLEFPAPGLLQAVYPVGWLVKGVERYSCDGVYVTSLKLMVSGKVKNGLTIQAEGALAVGPSYDREAKVIVELVVDGKVIGRGSKERIDAEERKHKAFRLTFKLSPEASALLERSESTVARLTLFVPEA